MTEQTTAPKSLTSDPDVLKKIKMFQFKRQLYPIIVVVAFILLNIFLHAKVLEYLTILSFGWYLAEKALFRTKNKIALPEPGMFVSPVDGKVQSIRRSEDVTLITLRKSFLDVVELRMPYTGMFMDNTDTWCFNTPYGLIEVRIKANKINYFTPRDETATVAGFIPGSAIIVIHLPGSIELNIGEKQNVFGGETGLFSLFSEPVQKQAKPSILVEEPLPEISDEEKDI